MLTGEDIGEIWSLHQLVIGKSVHGHLAERNREEIATAVIRKEGAASVGAWVDNKLIGYSLCSVNGAEKEWDSAFIKTIKLRGEHLWNGSGTVVHPDFNGRHLMQKLLRARGAEIARQGTIHTAGLIATDNLHSLVNAIRAGGWIVGQHQDIYCQNYVLYSGAEQQRVTLTNEKIVDCADLQEIENLVSNNWVGTKMIAATRNEPRRIVFHIPEKARE